MTQFLDFFIGGIASIVSMLNSDRMTFDVYGLPVSFLELLIGFLAFSMIIGVFWRGAKG